MSTRNPIRFDYAAIAQAYVSGQSIPKIVAAFGCSSPTVLRALAAQGVATRSISDGVSLAKRGCKRIDSGYVTVAVGKYRRRKEHVLIAESVLGRALKIGEVVHHINCNPLDNSNGNLLICSRAYHTELHWRMRSHPYWSQFNRRNV